MSLVSDFKDILSKKEKPIIDPEIVRYLPGPTRKIENDLESTTQPEMLEDKYDISDSDLLNIDIKEDLNMQYDTAMNILQSFPEWNRDTIRDITAICLRVNIAFKPVLNNSINEGVILKHVQEQVYDEVICHLYHLNNLSTHQVKEKIKSLDKDLAFYFDSLQDEKLSLLKTKAATQSSEITYL